MRLFLNKYKKGIALFMAIFIILSPLRSFAHNAYYLQVLVDDHKYQYVGSVINDVNGYMNKESKHLETEMGKFGGLKEDVRPYKETEEGYTDYEDDLNNDILIYTFSPKEIDNWIGVSKNHATGEDIDKAYFTQETLMAGLNDALKVVNGGSTFNSVEELMKKGQKLAMAINGSGTIEGYTVTKGRAYDGEMPKGVTATDYITIKDKKNDATYEFIYKVKKGYKSIDEFKDDTEYLTWNQLMYQGNYALVAKGYSLRNGAELSSPSALEEMVVGMFENTFNQLRNLLGLYEINELVFNEGIRGSAGWTHGIMAKDWSDKAIAYHWIFQALAWSVITFAIVKNLLQRNIATVNPAMRISLLESIQNLLITGVLLANTIPVLNMFMYLNAKLVAVFGATAPDFANLSELNAYSNMLGGIIIQFFYLGVSIYLNFVYIMRAITIAILIATAPLFIVTIAFGGKWKQLFSTWMRELIGNIFLQSFHAFMLSFFFAISTSSRGIEGMIVLTALIPMTEFFRTLVMGQGGGIAHSMGMKSMAQGATLVGGALSSNGGKPKQNGKSSSSGTGGGGSGREVSTSNANDSGMNTLAGNSEKIKNNSSTMNQRQRMNSTKEAMTNRETPVHLKKGDEKLDNYKSDLQTEPEGFGQKVRNTLEGAQESYQNAKETISNNPITKVAGGAIKGTVGATKVAVGLGTALAVGMENPKLGASAMKATQSGFSDMGSGIKQMGAGAMDTLPESTKAYATNLPNGDMQIHRNANTMAEQGVVGATMEGTKNAPIAKYTYDTNKIGLKHNENLSSAYGAFKGNDKDGMEHYRSQGIENITKNGNGNLVVRYNQVGMDKMGIKSVQTLGAGGSNPRIVETKASNAPNTQRTISIPAYERPATQPTQPKQPNNN